MNSVAGKTEDSIEELAEAERLKESGNLCFKDGDFEEAASLYLQALSAAPSASPSRAVYFGNKAACHMHLAQYKAAVDACTSSLKIKPHYIKVLLRRSAAYEQLKEYQQAVEDCKEVVSIHPEHSGAKSVINRLGTLLEQQNSEAKDEMIGKLKDLGNTVLGKFGVSLDDFKTEKDPDTGSYNIRFNQSKD